MKLNHSKSIRFCQTFRVNISACTLHWDCIGIDSVLNCIEQGASAGTMEPDKYLNVYESELQPIWKSGSCRRKCYASFQTLSFMNGMWLEGLNQTAR